MYYSYKKKQITKETAEFLRNIIYNEINKQLEIWVETNHLRLSFIEGNESDVDDYGFVKGCSLVGTSEKLDGSYIQNMPLMLTKLGLNIDDAVISLFQISKPLGEGGEPVYLDPESSYNIEPSSY